jgi:hypothetical protein
MRGQPSALNISKNWSKPCLAAFSNRGFILVNNPEPFPKKVALSRVQSQAAVIVTGHFLREDNGEDLVKTLNYWFEQ